MNRSRVFYLIFIISTIAAGLASRHFSRYLPEWVNLYLGDALWSLMVFFGFGFIFSRKSTIWVGVIALLFSFAIEISQLYQADWINSIRSIRLGGLILGFGFLWSDLICYTVGITAGVLLEFFLLRNKNK